MTVAGPIQLSLGISLNDDATFENFYTTDANKQAVSALEQFCIGHNNRNVLIWGQPGSGLTHLLQAVCHSAGNENKSVQFLPLRELIGFAASDVCEGLEQFEIVCLDSIDSICGNKEWEHALFHLFNNIRDAENSLLVSSHTNPPALPILLADLKSRMLGCVRYHITSLTDTDKHQALIKRAAARGMDMPGDVAQFILNRASRDTNELFYILDRLDDASLQSKRKLTIPFVKEILGL